MPILHIQFNVTEAHSDDGQPVSVPPSVGLRHKGPCLQVTVGLLQPMAQAMLQQGQQVPSPISGIALVDTGASDTCIDGQAAQNLGLPVVDVVTMASASEASASRNVYPVTIEVYGLPFPIGVPRAIGAELHPQGLIALIGRASCNTAPSSTMA